MIAGASKVPPETLRNPLAVELLRQCGKRQLPLREGCGPVALLVVGNGQAVIHVGTVGRKFERVFVLGDRVLGVTRADVVVGEGHVSGSARRTLLKNRRQIILRIAELRHAEIFAIPRAVVIPRISGKLLRAIDGLGET